MDVNELVTVHHLDAAIDRGLSTVKLDLELLRRDVDAIARRIDAKPLRRWMVGRVTRILDGGLPLALVAALTYALTHFL